MTDKHDRALELIDELVELLQSMPIKDPTGRTDVTLFNSYGQSFQYMVQGIEWHRAWTASQEREGLCQVRIENALAENAFTGKPISVSYTCLRPTPCDIHATPEELEIS